MTLTVCARQRNVRTPKIPENLAPSESPGIASEANGRPIGLAFFVHAFHASYGHKPMEDVLIRPIVAYRR